jgi:hypothetical protein
LISRVPPHCWLPLLLAPLPLLPPPLPLLPPLLLVLVWH